MSINWQGVQNMPSKSYDCGYCGASIASQHGFAGKHASGREFGSVYICHKCFRPSFMGSEGQTPGSLFGAPVGDLPETVGKLYEEARRSYGANSATAAVLCCRKLLMHVAVEKGAKPNGTFISYVEYLADQNYVPPGAKIWVDHIRTKGNEANHEITIMGAADAEDLLRFAEMLLKLVYEYPAAIARKLAPKP